MGLASRQMTLEKYFYGQTYMAITKDYKNNRKYADRRVEVIEFFTGVQGQCNIPCAY